MLLTDATFGIQVNTQKGENLDYYEAVTRILELGFETLYSPWLRIGVISRLFGHARKMDNYQLIVRRVQRTVVVFFIVLYCRQKAKKPIFLGCDRGQKRA